MEEAARLCDRLLIMHEGKILAEGSPRDLIAGHIAEYVVQLPVESSGGSSYPVPLEVRPSGVSRRDLQCMHV
jgi:ABC-type multidrug transport system ATPase subunit